MSTTEKAGAGKPVDAIITPVTVSAGLLPNKFLYAGISEPRGPVPVPSLTLDGRIHQFHKRAGLAGRCSSCPFRRRGHR